MEQLTKSISQIKLHEESDKSHNKYRAVVKPKKVYVNRSLPNFIQVISKTTSWTAMKLRKQTVRCVSLIETDKEYEDVGSLFNETSSNLTIDDIQRVQNPYLMFAYLLKKEQIKERFHCVNERKLFHATKQSYVDGILNNNFNWRFYGYTRGHKYGKGVCFSPKAQFADLFSEKSKRQDHSGVMFLAYVLVSKGCLGKPEMALPPDGFDTTKKRNGEVLVKFEDNEFYPAYVIYYHRT